ncbi:winged helix-turn-helix domain-containing protein [Kitasatospora viridis]|uniref:Transcriptional regulator n=1 Tax=Kitasatospora viridis TaxID=281105 RepID=A0A561UB41_9ACTN|nr:winged helix-turn-helix domain-containing protein [Kitasatospora viridis]TWF96571.1 transcriptional regulator [Kitasatospora viridis]
MSTPATLTPPAAVPHLRALRAVGSPSEDRRHPVPVVPAAPPAPTPDLLGALPPGATVVAALPQSALPQGLLAQYGAQLGTQFAGYLVLVPAEAGASAAAVPAAAVAPNPATAPVGPAAPVAEARANRGIAVDLDRRNAYVDGELLDLTYLEFELLAHLTQYPHRVHTRDHLVTAVWGYGHVGDGRTVDVHVARLRRKLGAAHRASIVTVRRVGYKYAPSARS